MGWQWHGSNRGPDEPTNLPLGIVDETEYAQVEATLEPGDMVLLVSDSLTEARDPKGQILGEQGLLEIVRNLNADEPDLLIPRLLQTVESHFSGNLSEDDTTILLLQATGGGAASWTVSRAVESWRRDRRDRYRPAMTPRPAFRRFVALDERDCAAPAAANVEPRIAGGRRTIRNSNAADRPTGRRSHASRRGSFEEAAGDLRGPSRSHPGGMVLSTELWTSTGRRERSHLNPV